jgi:hypothetical protein
MFKNPNIELELNFESAQKSKFKMFKKPYFELEFWKPEFRVEVEYRASSKIEIQSVQKPEFRTGVEFRASSKIEVQNVQKPEFSAGVEFRASSKIEIQNFENLNFELELNFEPARRSKFKIFKTQISILSWITSQLKIRVFKMLNNLNFDLQ